MNSKLKDHPFAVESHFDYSVVLTFAFPKEQLEYLLPECLTLDTYQGEWAFIAVAIVQTKGLRPKGFPSFMGKEFLLTGYRVFVRYTDNRGKKLRGLYILKSETNRKIMEVLGSMFTHYNYTTNDILPEQLGSKIMFTSKRSGFNVQIEAGDTNTSLPEQSPFMDWKEARRFAGPLPFTFTYNPENRKVLIVEGVRENWIPQPAKVNNYNVPYFEENGLTGGILANAFVVKNIPYWWKKGRTELWNH